MKLFSIIVRSFSFSGTRKGILPLLLASCVLGLAGCGGNSEKESTPTQDTVVLDTAAVAPKDSLAEAKAEEPKKPEIPLITDPHIVVDKPNLELRLVKGGEVIFRAPITCGRMIGQKKLEKDRRTPEGNFRIVSIEDATHKMYRTDDGRLVPHVYGPWFLRLDADGWGGIGIHGTNAPGQISQRRSKGCIRMLNKDIRTLHDYAKVGMQVIVLPDNSSEPNVTYASSAPVKKKDEETVVVEEVNVETPENDSSASRENTTPAAEPQTSPAAPSEPTQTPAPEPATNPAPAVPVDPAPTV